MEKAYATKEFIDLLVECGLCRSKAEAQRQIKQGAVRVYITKEDKQIEYKVLWKNK